MTIQELRQRREALQARAQGADAFDTGVRAEAEALTEAAFAQMDGIMRGARAAGRDLLADEARNYDSLEAIRADAAHLRLTHTPARGSVFPNLGGNSFDGGSRDSNPELREAFTGFLRTGTDAELRAQGVGVDAQGGFAVPEGFRAKIIESLKAFGGIRSVAEHLQTNDGRAMPFPTNDDTANDGVIVPENTAVGEQDLTLGEKELTSFLYSSKLIRVSFQLLQDSGVDLETFMARKFAQRIHRAQSGHFATGDRVGKPQGLVTGVNVGHTTAAGQTASVIVDDLVEMVHSVDPEYRAEECVWVMNDATYATIRKIKDADGRPLWQPDVQGASPNNLLGYRVVVDQGMPALGAGNKPLVFGNISRAYVVRDVRDLSVLRLGERYAEAHQVGFLGWLRSDGLVQDAAAAATLQNAAA